jgi:diguanylate cyclase (GGDEF)-like protein/PAS domain S-box-containing protein
MTTPLRKKWYWPRRLSTQIVLLVAIAFVAATSFYSWHISKELQYDTERFLNHIAVGVTSGLALHLADELHAGDPDAIERSLLSLRANNDIESISYADSSGIVISGFTFPGERGEYLRQKKERLIIPAGENPKVSRNDGLTTVMAPVVTDHTTGWLAVDFHFHHFNEIRNRSFVHNMRDGVAVIIIGSLVILFFIKKPIMTIRRAGEFAKRMDEFRGERFKQEGGSIEMEQLIASLNNTSAKLFRQERDVKENQQRLIRANKLARLGVWEWNVAEREFYWMDEDSEAHYQHEPDLETAVMNCLLESVPEDGREKVKNRILSALNDCCSCAFDHPVISGTGETRTVYHQVDVTCDDEGSVTRVMGTTKDVTERKKNERELRKRTKQILNILESTTDGYFSVDKNWRVQYFNARAEGLFGKSRDNIVGENLWDVVPELASSFFKPMSSSLRKNRDMEFVIGFYPPLERWLEMSCYPHVDGMSVYFRDVTQRRQSDEALKHSEARARVVLDNVHEAVISIDRYGNISTFNKTAENIFGYRPNEVVGNNISMLMPDKDAEKHDSYIQRYVFTGEARLIGVNRELLAKRKNGEIFPVEIDLREVHISSQPYFVGIVRDLSLRKKIEQDMRLSEQVFSSSVEGIVVFDENRNVLRVNQAFSRITGFAEEEVAGRKISGVFEESFETGKDTDIWYEVDRHGSWQGELMGCRPNGREFLVWLSFSVTRDDSGRITNYIAIFNDLTEIKEAQSRIHHLANYDVLTGLPNRVLFQDMLHRALVEAAKSETRLLLLRVDIDRFKTINDTLGDTAGDIILQKVAWRLKDDVRPTDIVARLSGDEFAIFCPRMASESDMIAVVRKLLASFNSPIVIDNNESFVTVSIGAAVFPGDSDNAHDLIRHAGKAMHHVKESGRNSFRFYTQDLDELAFERLILENSLRRALENKEFVLHYQPQVDLSSGQVIGVEALIRWQHPELGMVSPAKFIPMLEDTGLIVQVGEWVLEEACRQCSEWHKAGYDGIRIAVNLSPRQFEQQGPAGAIDKALHGSKMDPKFLDIEITESILMKNVDQNIQILKELKRKNIGISIDDFGTGYSSLSYLTQFPVDTLKIDRSFIMDVTEDPNDAALAMAIISMGHSLKIKVLAEGVETLEQLDFLRQHTCDEIQGFYFCKPLPAEDVREILSSRLSLSN